MPAPLPWLFEFWAEEGLRRGQPPLRPVVPVSLSFVEATPPQFSPVDSGSEHVLASSWLAGAVGIDLSHAEDRVTLGIGGQTVAARFAEVELRLHPSLEDDAFMDWRSDVGFVPGWRAPLQDRKGGKQR